MGTDISVIDPCKKGYKDNELETDKLAIKQKIMKLLK